MINHTSATLPSSFFCSNTAFRLENVGELLGDGFGEGRGECLGVSRGVVCWGVKLSFIILLLLFISFLAVKSFGIFSKVLLSALMPRAARRAARLSLQINVD